MTTPTPAPPVSALVLSLVRTAAMLVAGVVITWLANKGLHLDGATVTALVTGLFSGAYYVVARFLEHFVSRWFGWLLLAPAAPSYPRAPAR